MMDVGFWENGVEFWESATEAEQEAGDYEVTFDLLRGQKMQISQIYRKFREDDLVWVTTRTGLPRPGVVIHGTAEGAHVVWEEETKEQQSKESPPKPPLFFRSPSIKPRFETNQNVMAKIRGVWNSGEIQRQNPDGTFCVRARPIPRPSTSSQEDNNPRLSTFFYAPEPSADSESVVESNEFIENIYPNYLPGDRVTATYPGRVGSLQGRIVQNNYDGSATVDFFVTETGISTSDRFKKVNDKRSGWAKASDEVVVFFDFRRQLWVICGGVESEVGQELQMNEANNSGKEATFELGEEVVYSDSGDYQIAVVSQVTPAADGFLYDVDFPRLEQSRDLNTGSAKPLPIPAATFWAPERCTVRCEDLRRILYSAPNNGRKPPTTPAAPRAEVKPKLGEEVLFERPGGSRYTEW